MILTKPKNTSVLGVIDAEKAFENVIFEGYKKLK